MEWGSWRKKTSFCQKIACFFFEQRPSKKPDRTLSCAELRLLQVVYNCRVGQSLIAKLFSFNMLFNSVLLCYVLFCSRILCLVSCRKKDLSVARMAGYQNNEKWWFLEANVRPYVHPSRNLASVVQRKYVQIFHYVGLD